MIQNLPEGPQFYPEDMITDVQERFIVSEIVREKALRNLRDEVPHGIAVDIIQMKQNEKAFQVFNVGISRFDAISTKQLRK